MENIKSSLINIKSHPLRTILTLLGIAIGVFALISLSSMIFIVKSTIKTEMKDLGWNNSITVYSSSGSNEYFSFRRGRHLSRRMKRFMYMHRKSSPLTLKDFYDIKNNVPNIYCYASVESYGNFVALGKKSKASFVATNFDYLKLKKYKLIFGRYFNDIENNKHIKVCILSKNVAKELSKDPKNLIGNTLRYENITFKIIGIVDKQKKKKSFVRMGNIYEEKEIFIPLTTGIFYFRNSDKVDEIYIQAPSDKVYPKMKNLTRQILLRNHNMAHDFRFMDVGSVMLQISKEIDTEMKKWTILFITIASVSLLVGGIGLFSTLIISITERMNEIGIRKSVGAKNSDIFMLFISESLILSLLAAFSGYILSYALVKILSNALKQSFYIPLEGILLGFGFSVVIGFLSGLYPAIRAAKINPTKAIYYFQ